MSPAHPDISRRHVQVVVQLANWADRDGTGIVFDSSAGFTLPDTAMRGPDASWARRDRWEAARGVDERGFPRFVPDFAVEIMSPSDRIKAAERKMEAYALNGVRLGWLIDPKRRTVRIYRPGRPAERLEDPVTVGGDPELPGFTLDLSRIW
jgi:Uma2 family endonuclease